MDLLLRVSQPETLVAEIYRVFAGTVETVWRAAARPTLHC
jgi:hypothetical protein